MCILGSIRLENKPRSCPVLQLLGVRRLETVVIMKCNPHAAQQSQGKYKNKLLATQKTSTMQKEWTQEGENGFELVGLRVPEAHTMMHLPLPFSRPGVPSASGPPHGCSPGLDRALPPAVGLPA